jgi:hypothetical protein
MAASMPTKATSCSGRAKRLTLPISPRMTAPVVLPTPGTVVIGAQGDHNALNFDFRVLYLRFDVLDLLNEKR